jgi:hypothetical protein
MSGECIFTPSVALTVNYEYLESIGNVPGDDHTTTRYAWGFA